MATEDDSLNAILLDEIAAAGVAVGLPAETARSLAETVEYRLRLRVGGQSLHYRRRRDTGERDAAIRQAFAAGADPKRLAKRFQLSERRVRQILKA